MNISSINIIKKKRIINSYYRAIENFAIRRIEKKIVIKNAEFQEKINRY